MCVIFASKLMNFTDCYDKLHRNLDDRNFTLFFFFTSYLVKKDDAESEFYGISASVVYLASATSKISVY